MGNTFIISNTVSFGKILDKMALSSFKIIVAQKRKANVRKNISKKKTLPRKLEHDFKASPFATSGLLKC